MAKVVDPRYAVVAIALRHRRIASCDHHDRLLSEATMGGLVTCTLDQVAGGEVAALTMQLVAMEGDSDSYGQQKAFEMRKAKKAASRARADRRRAGATTSFRAWESGMKATGHLVGS